MKWYTMYGRKNGDGLIMWREGRKRISCSNVQRWMWVEWNEAKRKTEKKPGRGGEKRYEGNGTDEGNGWGQVFTGTTTTRWR